jgi:hypothetical protein
MNRRLHSIVAALILLAGAAVFAMQQQPGDTTPGGTGRGGGRRNGIGDDEYNVVLPSGRLQRDEMLKAEHIQNLKDAAELAALAQQLKIDLEKEDRFVLSMSTLKKTDDIEKLAKRIRTRLRHY